jgi:hypothetical protein
MMPSGMPTTMVMHLAAAMTTHHHLAYSVTQHRDMRSVALVGSEHVCHRHQLIALHPGDITFQANYLVLQT